MTKSIENPMNKEKWHINKTKETTITYPDAVVIIETHFFSVALWKGTDKYPSLRQLFKITTNATYTGNTIPKPRDEKNKKTESHMLILELNKAKKNATHTPASPVYIPLNCLSFSSIHLILIGRLKSVKSDSSESTY
ncbi:MAG: hypothetical protein KKF12_12125 [Proteobacteria bacterium]|nr:hypothetical protein [Desulfobacula sp.]MBU3953968.1 hypothetical protein [Pseudomonadota bacterium]MBU4035307.1 hypothetical protein [Pseudomonadota bacterium]MBU4131559.1 hypothetical protein [Pseudomonadota bacterium]